MQCEKCTFHQVTCGHLTETNHNSHVSGVINTSHCHEWQWSALGWSLQHEMFACPAQCERAELVPVITADLLVRSPREIQTLRPVGAAVSHYVTVSCELCTAPCLRVSLSCLMCVTMSSMFSGEADSGPSLTMIHLPLGLLSVSVHNDLGWFPSLAEGGSWSNSISTNIKSLSPGCQYLIIVIL